MSYYPPQGTPRPRRSALPWCIAALAVSTVAGAALVANGVGPVPLVPQPRTVAVAMPANLPAPTVAPQPAPTVTVQPAPRPTVTVTAPAPAAPRQDMGPVDGIDPSVRYGWTVAWSTLTASDQQAICDTWNRAPGATWEAFNNNADDDFDLTFIDFTILIEESCS